MPTPLLKSNNAKIAKGYWPLPLVASIRYDKAMASPPAASADPYPLGLTHSRLGFLATIPSASSNPYVSVYISKHSLTVSKEVLGALQASIGKTKSVSVILYK